MTSRPYNAASRKDIRSAEKRAIVEDTVRREVISGIMSVQNGRQWVYAQLESAQVFADPFSPDPYINAYNAGLRKIGIALFNDIMLFCPTYFEQMIKEAYVRSTATERSRSPDGNGGVDRPDPALPDGTQSSSADGYDHDPYSETQTN